MNEIIVPKNWINEIGEISADEWKNYSKNLNNIKVVKLRDFQFKINNRILVTNTFLFKIKKKETTYAHIATKKLKASLMYCFIVEQLRNSGKL